MVFDELKALGIISGYVAVAEKIGTNKAAISDIKGCRKRLSLDLLRGLKSPYPEINLNWVIMGEGTMFIDESPANLSSSVMGEQLLDIIQSKDQTIRVQAEEIGRLKERKTQQEKEKMQLEMEVSRGISPKEAARVINHTPSHKRSNLYISTILLGLKRPHKAFFYSFCLFFRP